MTTATAPTAQSERTGLWSDISSLARAISADHFPSGDRAALKRMAPDREPPLAFYRLAFSHLPEQWERQRSAWQTLVAGVAIMCAAPRPHDSGRPLGKVLAEHRYSEARLERLLAAEGDTLHTLLLRAARFLAAKKESVDWTDFARLTLITTNDDQHEKIRREIAGDYYRNLKEPNP
jgi:CRISPR system Cascade subunit CasB